MVVAGLVGDEGLVVELADPVDRAAAIALLVEDVLIGREEDLVGVVAREAGGLDLEPRRRLSPKTFSAWLMIQSWVP